MERYLDLDNVNRVAENYPEWLDDKFDYPLVSAKLLGTDVNRCATNTPVAVFNAVISSLRPDTIERSLAYAMHRVGEDADLLYMSEFSRCFLQRFCDFKKVFKKLGVNNRAAAVYKAVQYGLLSLDSRSLPT